MPGGFHRFVGVDAHGQDAATTELGFDEFRSAIARIAGSDFGMRDPVWLSRFGNATRQAATYRTGRVMLAGDAAHMHFPTGGVGMNVGLQDAMNLGWKLAAVVNGVGGVGLLDSYHRERHPVGTDLLENSLAQTAVIAGVSHSGLGLRAFLNRLIGSCPELSRTLAERLAALHVSYPPEDPSAHAAVGRRAPNLGATDSDLFQSLRPGKPVLVSSADGPVDVDAELSVVRQAAADGEKPDWLPVEAALIRPDGHVAWATDSAVGADEVRIALNSMFERPTTSS
ncbi:MAG: FAD-dependent monooxygenase [Actinomycetia bacterium]|nr:FAD-dependent monooxygenase [Actinomycetes bacterium]